MAISGSSYTKSVELSIKLPHDARESIRHDVQSALQNIGIGAPKLTHEAKSALVKQLGELQQKDYFSQSMKGTLSTLRGMEQTKEVREAIAEITKTLKEAGIDVEKEENKKKLEDAKKNFGEFAKDAAEKLWDKFSDFVSDIGDLMGEILQNISSSFTTSYRYSSKEWETYSNYGLSGAQGYAMREAMSRMNLSSLEDYYKMVSMNPESADRFNELFEKYEKQYEQNKELAEEVQKFQEEWTDFKEEIATDFLKWFSENKDTVKAVMEFGLTVLKGLAEIIGDIINFFGGDSGMDNTIPESSDIVQNYVNNNKDTRMTNNFNYNVNGTNATQVVRESTNQIQRQLAFQ